MAFDYFLLFKTAPAEYRAWGELDSGAKRKITPIIELTRGRKRPKFKATSTDLLTVEGVYNFEGIVSRTRDAFSGCGTVILDLTREPTLSCYEIEKLSASDDGYKGWVDFLIGERGYYDDLIPTLIVNPKPDETEDQYRRNISDQFVRLTAEFSAVSYRAAVLVDPDFIYDIHILADLIREHIGQGKSFFVELDHEFIRPGMGMLHALSSSEMIKNINALIPGATFVILATSFPKAVDDIGDPEEDSFPMEETFLFDEIKRLSGVDVDIRYGDYGSINPTRNDQLIQGSGGWRPRIDFPTSKRRIYYYREKRERIEGSKTEKTPYADHYVSVAKDVVKNPAFEEIPNSWGVKQILEAKNGKPPGKAPSFWISVRMEIFIRQQLRRLGLA